MNRQIHFSCEGIGYPDTHFLGWETSHGVHVTGSRQTNSTQEGTFEDTNTASLYVDSLTTCQEAGGYVCAYDNGNPSNIVRSPVLECPTGKWP